MCLDMQGHRFSGEYNRHCKKMDGAVQQGMQEQGTKRRIHVV